MSSGHPIQEEDRIHSGKIILVGVVSLAIFIVGGYWSRIIQKASEPNQDEAARPAPAMAGKPEVGIVYQTPFSQSAFGSNHAEQMDAHLKSYGWVDKQQKVIHVPIDKAMQELAAESANAPAAPSGGATK